MLGQGMRVDSIEQNCGILQLDVGRKGLDKTCSNGGGKRDGGVQSKKPRWRR